MKRTISIFCVLASLAFGIQAQNKITIKITGIKEIKGSIAIAIFDSKDTFLKKGLEGKRINIEDVETEITFENLLDGEYAIAVYQDENDNKKLDTGLLGIPTEKYGFSNNANVTFGPPKFDDAKFKATGDTFIEIELK